MELQEFISNTLINIVNGIKDANSKLPQEGGQVAFWMDQDNQKNIQFDVAVTVNETETTNGKGGFKIAIFNAGAEKGKTSSHDSVSRIKFEIGPFVSLC